MSADSILIAADHGAFELKEKIREYLTQKGFSIQDEGVYDTESSDYPAYAAKVASAVSSGQASCGILLCGTGLGMSMAANRYPGVRAALCNDVFSAGLSKSHNNANILVLGGRVIGDILAFEIVDTWLNTPFDGGRHQRRLDMFDGCPA